MTVTEPLRRKYALWIALAAIVVVAGVIALAYWWTSHHGDGAADMPPPQWLQLPSDATIVMSRGPRRSEMLREGPVQYVRMRLTGSAESAQATMDGILEKWNPSGGKPGWRTLESDMQRRQEQPEWLQDVMLPDDQVLGGRYTEFSDGATTYVEVIVVPTRSGALVEIVVKNML